jgi:predicted acetyltransferase
VGAVVLGVTDPLLPANDGNYELSASGARRVRRRADLLVPIDALGAIYLGGTSVAELVGAGQIHEVRRGAAARADALLRSPLGAWCGTYF